MSLYKQGLYDRAFVVAKKSLAVAEQTVGPNHPDLATSLNNLAGLYDTQSQYGQADSQVKFLSRGKGYSLFLTSTEAVLQLPICESRISTDEGRMTRDELQIPNFEFQIDNGEPIIPCRQLAFRNRNSQIR